MFTWLLAMLSVALLLATGSSVIASPLPPNSVAATPHTAVRTARTRPPLSPPTRRPELVVRKNRSKRAERAKGLHARECVGRGIAHQRFQALPFVQCQIQSPQSPFFHLFMSKLRGSVFNKIFFIRRHHFTVRAAG